jgi:hypothetical protein
MEILLRMTLHSNCICFLYYQQLRLYSTPDLFSISLVRPLRKRKKKQSHRLSHHPIRMFPPTLISNSQTPPSKCQKQRDTHAGCNSKSYSASIATTSPLDTAIGTRSAHPPISLIVAQPPATSFLPPYVALDAHISAPLRVMATPTPPSCRCPPVPPVSARPRSEGGRGAHAARRCAPSAAPSSAAT